MVLKNTNCAIFVCSSLHNFYTETVFMYFQGLNDIYIKVVILLQKLISLSILEIYISNKTKKTI